MRTDKPSSSILLSHSEFSAAMANLMTLPYDVREKILFLLHHEDTRYGTADRTIVSMDFFWKRLLRLRLPPTKPTIDLPTFLTDKHRLSSQLLCCCRQIHDESSGVLYGRQPIELNYINRFLQDDYLNGLLGSNDYGLIFIPQGPRNLHHSYQNIKHLQIDLFHLEDLFRRYHGDHRPGLYQDNIIADQLAVENWVRQHLRMERSRD